MKHISAIISLVIFLTAGIALHAQNVLVNPGGGSYATLQAAFTAIGAGTHTGTVTVQIVGNTTESGTCTLPQLTAGTTVRIVPVGQRTVSGQTDGAPLIDLNGADDVTMDGLNADGNSLTIQNTSTASTLGTSTIRLVNNAQQNTITRCTILGSSQTTGGTEGGTMVIGAALAGASSPGNDNNVISFNAIGPAGSNLPTRAIMLNGIATNTVNHNSGNQLLNNHIYDFFFATGLSSGISIRGGISDCLIKGNRLFQTVGRQPGASSAHTPIEIALAANAANNLVEENTIGYSSAAQTGTYVFENGTATSRMYGIHVNAVSPQGVTIKGNRIAGISFSGSLGGTGTTFPFAGVYAQAAVTSVDSNIIGGNTPADRIQFSTNTVGTAYVYGICILGSQINVEVPVERNIVAGIETTATNSGLNIQLIGIYASMATTNRIIINRNTIGGENGALINNSVSSFARLWGINVDVCAARVTNNSISNLQATAANISSTTATSVIGIYLQNSTSTGNNNEITGNLMHTLSNTNPTSAVWVMGVNYNGPAAGNHLITNNFIYNLLIPSSTSSGATLAGIYISPGSSGSVRGTGTYANNRIVLGNGITTNSPGMFGMSEIGSGNSNSFYHNSIFIGGTSAITGSSNSFAFSSNASGAERNYINNIFCNLRSTTSGGKHFAIRLGGTGVNPTGLVSNNNVLFSANANTFGSYASIDRTFNTWKSATGQDANSVSANPLFENPTADVPDLHLSSTATSPAENLGQPIAAVTTDMDGDARSATTPDAGADEKVAALPVAWGQTDVARQGQTNLVTWTTLTETNVRGFDVERSFDGRNFARAGFVASHAPGGNSSRQLTYLFADHEPMGREVFYRIRQTDLDGKSSLSRVHRLPAVAAGQAQWTVAVNPVANNLVLQVQQPARAFGTVRISDASGKLVLQQRLQLEAGSFTYRMDVHQLAPGLYSILLLGGDGGAGQAKKFVKE